jgi:hypothetical protein
MPRKPRKTNIRKLKCPYCGNITLFKANEKKWAVPPIIKVCDECQNTLNFNKILSDIFLSG